MLSLIRRSLIEYQVITINFVQVGNLKNTFQYSENYFARSNISLTLVKSSAAVAPSILKIWVSKLGLIKREGVQIYNFVNGTQKLSDQRMIPMTIPGSSFAVLLTKTLLCCLVQ